MPSQKRRVAPEHCGCAHQQNPDLHQPWPKWCSALPGRDEAHLKQFLGGQFSDFPFLKYIPQVGEAPQAVKGEYNPVPPTVLAAAGLAPSQRHSG